MGSESSSSTMPDRDVIKELGRRRVFGFFWVFFVVAIAQTLQEEGDTFMHVLDNQLDIVVAAIAIVILALWWKKTSLQDLKRTNMILTVLAVVLVLLTVFAFTQELPPNGDMQDLADDIPTLFFGIFMLLNRLV